MKVCGLRFWEMIMSVLTIIINAVDELSLRVSILWV